MQLWVKLNSLTVLDDVAYGLELNQAKKRNV